MADLISVSAAAPTTAVSSSTYVASADVGGSNAGIDPSSAAPAIATSGSFAAAPQAAHYAGPLTRANFRFVRRRTTGTPSVISLTLGGRVETFLLEIEDGFVYLRHPRWSWVGVGHTLLMAERDLLASIEDIAHVMADIPLDELSSDGQEFRHFALSFL